MNLFRRVRPWFLAAWILVGLTAHRAAAAAAPVFTTHPANQTAGAGSTATFTVVATGDPAPTLRWQVSADGGNNWSNLDNIAPYAGVVTPTLTITGTTAGLHGRVYRCRASNPSFSNLASAHALLAVIAGLPAITAQPSDQVSTLNGGAIFSVSATGSGLRFQWLRNGVPIPGATFGTLSLSGLKFSDGGVYTVMVSNAVGGVVSRPATLAGLNAPPVIVTAPADTLVTSGQTASLFVNASGSSSLFYQWRRRGIPIAAATTATLTIPSVNRAAVDYYDVVVADGLSVAVSAPARLAVAPTAYPGFVAPDPAWEIRPELAGGGAAYAVALLPDGRAYGAGTFASLDGVRRPHLARFTAEGSLDLTFVTPEIDHFVRCVVVQPDGKVIIAGDFARVGGYSRPRIARLHPDGQVDTAFNPGAGADGAVEALALQADGRVVVGGSFANYAGTSRAGLVRLNSDGTLDAGYLNLGMYAEFGLLSPLGVFALVVQPDGKLIVGGSFSHFLAPGGNLSRQRFLGRLNTDGSHDKSFAPSPGEAVRTLALQETDGKVVAGGVFTTANSVPVGFIARFAADGAHDTAFTAGNGTGFDSGVTALAVQPDGRVLVGGGFSSFNTSTPARRFVRLNADGSFDHGFQTRGFNYWSNSIGLHPDGRISVAGAFSTFHDSNDSPVARLAFARINSNGTLDNGLNFSMRRPAGATDLLPLPDGGAIVAGSSDLFRGATVPAGLTRLRSDGSADATFNAGGTLADAAVRAMVRQPDGKFVLTGGFKTYKGSAAPGIVRIHADGTVDASFNPGAGLGGSSFTGRTLLLLSGGRILVGGTFSTVNGVVRTNLAVLHADGSLDVGFDAGSDALYPISCAGLDLEGRILVGSDRYAGMLTNGITRLFPDGSFDATFSRSVASGPRISVAALVVQPDGKILVGGGALSTQGAVRRGVARLTSSGAIDSTFTPPALNPVTGIVLQEDGRILVHGAFPSVDGATPVLVRLNADGTLDPTFAAGGLAPVDQGRPSLMMQDNGRLVMRSNSAVGIIATHPAALPAVVSLPESQGVMLGATAVLTVEAASVLPLSYRWTFNGLPLTEATSPTLTLPDFRATQAGEYGVVVANELGSAPVVSALLTVGPAAVIVAQPVAATLEPGATARLTVIANGTPAPAYRWQRQAAGTTGFLDVADNAFVDGATTATLTLANVTSAQRGDQFRCIVSNGIGSPVISTPVTLTINGPPMIASPAAAKFIVGRPGRFAVAATGSPVATFRISAGALPAWATLDASTGVISGTPPDGNSAPATFTLTADNGRPPPATQTFTLTVQPGHSADVAPADGTLNLTELTRVIELYNTHTGTVRTGRYVISAATVDGYASDPSVTAGPIPTTPHTADLNRDGRLSLTELTRVIELFNTRAGTTRTGAYHIASTPTSSEDGFAPGP